MKKTATIKPQLYYAHPMEMYGTAQEKEDLRMMAKVFPGYSIYNPNCRSAQKGYAKEGFEFFLCKVSCSDLVVFRSIETPPLHDLWDGVRDIGAGVGKEVILALEIDVPVLEVPWAHKVKRRTLSIEATRLHIKQMKARK